MPRVLNLASTIAAITLAAAPIAARAETLNFSTQLDSSLSSFDFIFGVSGNPNFAGFLVELEPSDPRITGQIAGQIVREDDLVTAVDTQSAEFQLRDAETDDTFTINETIGEFPTVDVEAEISNPGVRIAEPTGPRPVNSPFDATVARVENLGQATLTLSGSFFGQSFSQTIFDGDLEDEGVGFGPLPLTGEIESKGGDDYVLTYSLTDTPIAIIGLPALIGGGTAEIFVESLVLVTDEFTATPAGGPAVIPLPAPALLLASGLAALAAVRRARG